jgi:hypothetical protein
LWARLVEGFVAQSDMTSYLPLPLTNLSDYNGSWDAKGGEGVEHRSTDLNFRNLPVKVSRFKSLTE